MALNTQPPKHLKIAIYIIFLWSLIDIGIFWIISDVSYKLSIPMILFSQFLSIIFLMLFLYLFWKGKNWARILYTILFILGCFSFIYITISSIFMGYYRSIDAEIEFIIATLTILLHFYLLYALYNHEGNLWFKR